MMRPLAAEVADVLRCCFDGALEGFCKDWQRKGLVPKSSGTRSVVAFDLKTGEDRWRVDLRRLSPETLETFRAWVLALTETPPWLVAGSLTTIPRPGDNPNPAHTQGS